MRTVQVSAQHVYCFITRCRSWTFGASARPGDRPELAPADTRFIQRTSSLRAQSGRKPVRGPSVSWGLKGPASGLCFAETPSVEISTQETTLQVSVSLHSVWAAYSCVGEILNSTGKGPLPRLTGDQQEAIVKGYLPAEITWQLTGQKAAPETPGPAGTRHAWLFCFPCTDVFECLHFLNIREFNTKIPISAL